MSFWNTVYSKLLRITTSGRYIAEVDGFRFIAITGVLLFHIDYAMYNGLGLTLSRGPLDHAAAYFIERGYFGVQLFFIISGFILALPFIQQYTLEGKPVHLKAYYLRRLTRLEPPYLISLTLFFIAAMVLNEDIGRGTYLSQYLLRSVYAFGLVYNEGSLLNGVTWSLEIEVQFYVLVPLLVRIFRLSANLRRGLLLALIVAFSFRPFHDSRLAFTVLNFLQYFLAGFLVADVYLHHIAGRQKHCLKHDWAGLGLIAAGTVLARHEEAFRFGLPLLGAAFYYTVFQGRVLNRILTNKVLCIVGGMCYTIYLCHYPFIKVMTDRLVTLPLGDTYLARFLAHAMIMLPVLGVIWLVYYSLIERPCMDRRWPRKLWSWTQARFSRKVRRDSSS